jgi:hypothetical protein
MTTAAERLSLSPKEKAELGELIDPSKPQQTNLPAETAETLLVVDQFEELFTQTPVRLRAPFIDWLLSLVAPGAALGFRVVLTIRSDYFNLCSTHSALFGLLKQDNVNFRLKQITQEGLSEIVREPLGMAGHKDRGEQDALLAQVRRDVSDRPGDLALIQMALFETWKQHKLDKSSLLEAYTRVGGVPGALAHAAEELRTKILDAKQQDLVESVFVRLINLGDTGGATRRIARIDEFDGPHAHLVRMLSEERCSRLLLLNSDTVEICHEQLITQWPWLQSRVTSRALDVRRLGRLIEKVSEWHDAERKDKDQYLATGAELGVFTNLGRRNQRWLSHTETEYILASKNARPPQRGAWRVRGVRSSSAEKSGTTRFGANEVRITDVPSQNATRPVTNPLTQTLAIILGASEWPDDPTFEPHQSFQESADFFREYLLSNGVAETNLLWLLNDQRAPDQIYWAISEFLRTLLTPSIGSVLFYYAGYALYSQGTFRLTLRCTRRRLLEFTTLPVEYIGWMLNEQAHNTRQIIILDASHPTAAALSEFIYQGPDHVPASEFRKYGRNASIFCAWQPDPIGRTPQTDKYTMFSGALRRALIAGDRNSKEFLSLERVAELVKTDIRNCFPDQADMFQVEAHSYGVKGKFPDLPLFPNAAFETELDSTEQRVRAERNDLRSQERTENRRINAWFEDGEPPLEKGRTYRLGINIGTLRDHSLATVRLPDMDWKETDNLDLLIVLSGHGFLVKPRERVLKLPKTRDTETVFFAITPIIVDDVILRISVYLARELMLLEEFEIPINVRQVIWTA